MDDFKIENATADTNIDLSWVDNDVLRHIRRTSRELNVPGDAIINSLLRSAIDHQKVVERHQSTLLRGKKQQSASSKHAIPIGSSSIFMACMFLIGIVLAVLYVVYWQ